MRRKVDKSSDVVKRKAECFKRVKKIINMQITTAVDGMKKR